MRLSLNPQDLARIKGKLEKLNFVTKELSNPANPLYDYRISVLLAYQGAVTRVMGSVKAVDYKAGESGYSGSVSIEIPDLGSDKTHWKNLHPMTIDTKNRMGYRLVIWEATGAAKSHVRIHKEDGFVGLTPEDGEAYDHAVRTEFGGVSSEGETPLWEKRGLFTIANKIVLAQQDKIIDRIKQIILTYVSWGR